MFGLGKRWQHWWKKKQHCWECLNKSGLHLKQTSFMVKNTKLWHYKNIPDWLNIKWLHTLTWPDCHTAKHQRCDSKCDYSFFAAHRISCLSVRWELHNKLLKYLPLELTDRLKLMALCCDCEEALKTGILYKKKGPETHRRVADDSITHVGMYESCMLRHY